MEQPGFHPEQKLFCFLLLMLNHLDSHEFHLNFVGLILLTYVNFDSWVKFDVNNRHLQQCICIVVNTKLGAKPIKHLIMYYLLFITMKQKIKVDVGFYRILNL